MTGLQVAPTAPQPSAARSSAGVAESFHRHVGVVCVMRSSGGASALTAAAWSGRVWFTRASYLPASWR